MKDFVRILETYCISKNIQYHYGKKAFINLLSSELTLSQIYCLHDTSPRKLEFNENKTRVKSILFTGNFMLCKNSTIDMPYFQEVKNDQARSKYVINIEPLLDIFHQMAKDFACGDLEVVQFEAIDVVDVLDVNKDGILITYQVRKYEFN